MTGSVLRREDVQWDQQSKIHERAMVNPSLFQKYQRKFHFWEAFLSTRTPHAEDFLCV